MNQEQIAKLVISLLISQSTCSRCGTALILSSAWRLTQRQRTQNMSVQHVSATPWSTSSLECLPSTHRRDYLNTYLTTSTSRFQNHQTSPCLEDFENTLS